MLAKNLERNIGFGGELISDFSVDGQHIRVNLGIVLWC